MLKQTVHLLIKACIIGILINIGLEQVPGTTASAEGKVPQQSQQILNHQTDSNHK